MTTVIRVAIAGRVARIQVRTMSELHTSRPRRMRASPCGRPGGNTGDPAQSDARFSTGLVENLWTGATPAQTRPVSGSRA